MADERQCGECGGMLPGDAPQGLCPQCLMKLGLPSESTVKEPGVKDEQAAVPTGATPPGGFVAPEPKELAKEFPQLEIFELLGQGGMGAVYKARQKQLDRLVALKILPPEVGKDPAFAERFSREARSLARLNHSGIVSIYDFGHTQDGLYYFIMEFVDGTDLRHLIEGGHLEPRQALAIVPQICEALQYAHEEGLVHRDIKPENILLDKKGKVKIADFGLAKLLGKPATAYTLTQAGQRMGTPHYMAPEQIEGAHQVDHRADIYSLGVVFYEMLTGQLPIGRFAPPSQKVQIDVRLDKVVLKSLEHEPELRYQHASEVKTDIESVSTPDRIAVAHDHSHGAARRFSRTSIIGACWSLLALLWIPVAVIHTSKMQKSAIEEVVVWLCILIGSSPVFGTTILGIISIRQIRQAGGRLCGMGLAVFDALLFPVLGLDAVIFLILALLALLTRIPWVLPLSAGHFAGVLVLPVCAVVDYFVFRRALRKANAGLGQTTRPQQPWPPAPQRQEYRQAGGRLGAEQRLPDELPGSEPDRPIVQRFSRKSIAGAACIPLFVPLVVMLSTKEGYDRFGELFTPTGENWGQWAFTFIVSAIGVASPFATTILGFVSLWEIRRSRGSLAGLPLALADAILFPLIIVDFFIFVISVSNFGMWGDSNHIPQVLPFVFLACAVVDFLLIRWAWRKAKGPVERRRPKIGRDYPAEAAAMSSAKSETLQANQRIDEIETEYAPEARRGTKVLSLVVRHADVYGGFAEAHGILRLEGDDLNLEYRIEDGIFGIIKSSVRTAQIPLDQIASIRVQAGRRKTNLTIQTSTWKALDNVPGSKAGLVTLEVSAKHNASIGPFIEQLKEKLPDGTVQGYPKQQSDANGDADLLDGPAKAMMTGGILLMACAAPTAVPFITDSSFLRRFGADEWSVGTILLAILVITQIVAIPVGGVITSAAKNLKRRQSYAFAVAAGILMLLPLGVGSVVGIPLGIWVLVELKREEVKALFPRKAADLSRQGKWNGFCIIAFLLSLVAGVMSIMEIDPYDEELHRAIWIAVVVLSLLFACIGLWRHSKYKGMHGISLGIGSIVIALAAFAGSFVTIYYPISW